MQSKAIIAAITMPFAWLCAPLAQGAVVVYFHQDGNDVKATAKGDLKVLNGSLSAGLGEKLIGQADTLVGLKNGVLVYSLTNGTSQLSSLDTSPTSFTGASFGYENNVLYYEFDSVTESVFDSQLNQVVSTVELETTWVWQGVTLNGIGLAGLTATEQLVYTVGSTNDTISFALTTVPEPSSVVTLAVAALGFLVMRKR